MTKFGSAPVGRAKVSVNSSQTASVVVPGISGKRIRVLSCAFSCGAVATNATFNSASTAISMLFANGANGGAVLPHNPLGWFETELGEALTLTTGAGTPTGAQVVYAEI